MKIRAWFYLTALVTTCMIFAYHSMRILTHIIAPLSFDIITLRPFELYTTRIEITAIMTFFIMLPFATWVFYIEMADALKHVERRFVKYSLIPASICVSIGFVSAFFVIVPLFVSLIPMSEINHTISLGAYIAFLINMSLAASFVCTVPVIIISIVVYRIVPITYLTTFRRHVYVISSILAALLTPPDIVSQVLLAVPVIGLYELSIVVSKIFYKDKI